MLASAVEKQKIEVLRERKCFSSSSGVPFMVGWTVEKTIESQRRAAVPLVAEVSWWLVPPLSKSTETSASTPSPKLENVKGNLVVELVSDLQNTMHEPQFQSNNGNPIADAE